MKIIISQEGYNPIIIKSSESNRFRSIESISNEVYQQKFNEHFEKYKKEKEIDFNLLNKNKNKILSNILKLDNLVKLEKYIEYSNIEIKPIKIFKNDSLSLIFKIKIKSEYMVKKERDKMFNFLYRVVFKDPKFESIKKLFVIN